jgi:general secretion pathway protein C
MVFASMGYWGVRIIRNPAVAVFVPEVTTVAFVSDATARQVNLAHILGASVPVVVGPGLGPAERFSLVGVIASMADDEAALISVDDRPARPFAVGVQVAPGYLLESVGRREATLASDSQSRVVLSLPPHPTAASLASPPAMPSAVLPPAQAQITDSGPPASADSQRQAPALLRHEDRQNPDGGGAHSADSSTSGPGAGISTEPDGHEFFAKHLILLFHKRNLGLIPLQGRNGPGRLSVRPRMQT